MCVESSHRFGRLVVGERSSPGSGTARRVVPRGHGALAEFREDILVFRSASVRALAPSVVEQSAGAPLLQGPPLHRGGRDLPDRPAVTRLVGAVMSEYHDEGRCSPLRESRVARRRPLAALDGEAEEVMPELVAPQGHPTGHRRIFRE